MPAWQHETAHLHNDTPEINHDGFRNSHIFSSLLSWSICFDVCLSCSLLPTKPQSVPSLDTHQVWPEYGQLTAHQAGLCLGVLCLTAPAQCPPGPHCPMSNESFTAPGKLRWVSECVARPSHFVLPILCLANVLFKSDKWSPGPTRPTRLASLINSLLEQWGPGTHWAGHRAQRPDNLTWPTTCLINVPSPVTQLLMKWSSNQNFNGL